MLRGTDVQEIMEMKREGLSTQAISELTGYDRKTVRKYLLKPETAAGLRAAVGGGRANWNHTSRI